ncbi:unnamed protein product [Caenorhabditis nigoni]
MHHQEDVGPKELTSHQQLPAPRDGSTIEPQIPIQVVRWDQETRRDALGYGSGGEQLNILIIILITVYY